MRTSRRSRSRRGFSLIELMLTVAIIGLLAAIAIPGFLTYQARARRSEGYATLSSLARAMQGYNAETGRFPDMRTEAGVATLPDPGPYGGLGTSKMLWDADTQSFFDIIGFGVEGNVFYTYDVSAPDGGSCTCAACFTAAAHGDVDGDGGWGVLMYAYPQRDASGAVLGECATGMIVPAPPPGGQLWAPAYDSPVWHPAADEF